MKKYLTLKNIVIVSALIVIVWGIKKNYSKIKAYAQTKKIFGITGSSDNKKIEEAPSEPTKSAPPVVIDEFLVDSGFSDTHGTAYDV